MGLLSGSKQLEQRVSELEQERDILSTLSERNASIATSLALLRVSSLSDPDEQIKQGFEIIKRQFGAKHVHLAYMDLDATRDAKRFRDLHLVLGWSTNKKIEGTALPITNLTIPDAYDPNEFERHLNYHVLPPTAATCFLNGISFMYTDMDHGEVKKKAFPKLGNDAKIDLHEFDKTVKIKGGKTYVLPGDRKITLLSALVYRGGKVKLSQEEIKSGEHGGAREVYQYVPEGVLMIQEVENYIPFERAVVLHSITEAFAGMLEARYDHIDPITKLFTEEYLYNKIQHVGKSSLEGKTSYGYLTLLKLDDLKEHKKKTRRVHTAVTSRGIELFEGYVNRRLGQVIHEVLSKCDPTGFASRIGIDTFAVYTKSLPTHESVRDMIEQIDKEFTEIPFASEKEHLFAPEEADLAQVTLSSLTFHLGESWKEDIQRYRERLRKESGKRKNVLMRVYRDSGGKEQTNYIKEGVPYPAYR